MTVAQRVRNNIIRQVKSSLDRAENKYSFDKNPLVGGNPAKDIKHIVQAIEKYGFL